jgi:LacI family transcriptional regulator
MKEEVEKRFRVTVCVDATKRMGHDAFEGIVGFIRMRGCKWDLHSSAGNKLWLPTEIETIPPGELDGIISYDANTALIRKMTKRDVRWVSIFEDPLDGSIPAVLSDNEAIGRLAGQHLWELHLKHFVYYGSDLANNSEARFLSYADFLAEQGAAEPVHLKISAEEVMLSLSVDRRKYLRKLGEELLALTNNRRDGLGVFAYSDHMGITVIDACREVGLTVPGNVAVIAVATDDILCEFSVPPLTAILQDAKKIGREAAAMLDTLLKGKRLKETRIRVPPMGITTRASTDIFATSDPYVIKALGLIRERFRESLNIGNILAELKISRRLFEKRFRLALGRSPYEEITRMRVRYAESLLVQTDYSIPAIAEMSGFASGNRFRDNFTKVTGRLPTDYRQKRKSK